MRCESCGNENPDEARFCNMCAKPLEPALDMTISTERSWTKTFWFSNYTVYPERERDFIVIKTRSPVFASWRQEVRYSKTLWYSLHVSALVLFLIFGLLFSFSEPASFGCLMTGFWIGAALLGFWFFVWITMLPPK